jgi:hypothetical protein
MNALVNDGDPGEIADVLHARALEMLELLPGVPEPIVAGIERARKQIELRRGAGFLSRVAPMGRPAAQVLNVKAFAALNANALTSHRIQ